MISSSYIEPKSVEISLVALFSALAVATRFFAIPIVPGLIVVDLAGALTYTPASLVSLPLSFVFVLVNTVMAPNPFYAFWAWIASIPLVNVASRLASRYRMWTPLLGPYVGITVFSAVIHLLGEKTFFFVWTFIAPRATVNFAAIIFLSPTLWMTLKKLRVLR